MENRFQVLNSLLCETLSNVNEVCLNHVNHQTKYDSNIPSKGHFQCYEQICKGMALCNINTRVPCSRASHISLTNCCSGNCKGFGICEGINIDLYAKYNVKKPKICQKRARMITSTKGLCKKIINETSKYKGLKLAHINIRSLVNKVDQLRVILDGSPIDVLAVSETWLDDAIMDHEMNIEGYSFYRNDRNRNGGGVALYVSNTVVHEHLPSSSNKDIETCWIEVKLNNQGPVRVCACYRPPNVNVDYFNRFVDELEEALGKDGNIVVLGDLNINYDLNENLANNPIHYVENLLNVQQLVTEPTRVTNRSSSTIDLILSSIPEKHVKTGVIRYTLSDHYMIYTVLEGKSARTEPRILTYRNYDKFDDVSFCNDLNNAIERSNVMLCTDVNEAWKQWKLVFEKVCNQHAPIKHVRVRNRNNPWVTADIIKLMYKRDYVHGIAVKNNDPHLYAEYCLLRNQVTSSIQESKRSYYESEIKLNENKKGGTWKVLNKLIPSKSKTASCQLNPEELNDYFCSIGKKLGDKYDKNPEYEWKLPKSIHQFRFYEITQTMVLKELKGIPDKSNIDVLGIDGKILRIAASCISESLTHLFNLSLCTGIIPTDWKKARVVPIYKGKGKQSDKSNYRPISMISHISKILEREVQQQLLYYLIKHSFITKDQSAYLKFHSTLTSLHKVACDWYDAINDGDISCTCFLDLAKCFDTINHDMLLYKMTKYGIINDEIIWFKDYLNDRTQYVALNGKISTEKSVQIGVPQGSVLGPILFLLFVNDLPSIVSNTQCNMFADDTLFYCSGSNISDIQECLQKDIDKVVKWLTENKLTLNVDKCCTMAISHPHKVADKSLKIIINNQQIENVSNCKYLGVNIDQALNWSSHINTVCKMISSKIGVLRRLSNVLPSHILNTVYNSIVKPHFDYCVSVWGYYNVTDIDQLQKLQNRAARIVSGVFDFNISSDDLICNLKWLRVKELRDLQTLSIMYKCQQNKAPNYLSDKFSLLSDVSNYNTRRKNLYNVEQFKSKTAEQSLSYNGPILFNSLPKDIRCAEDFKDFKCKAKNWFYAQRIK